MLCEPHMASRLLSSAGGCPSGCWGTLPLPTPGTLYVEQKSTVGGIHSTAGLFAQNKQCFLCRDKILSVKVPASVVLPLLSYSQG